MEEAPATICSRSPTPDPGVSEQKAVAAVDEAPAEAEAQGEDEDFDVADFEAVCLLQGINYLGRKSSVLRFYNLN